HVFIAMELVRGPSLRRYFEIHPDARFEDVLALFVDAGRGLAAAHGARVVHRDFKPENVLVDAAAAPSWGSALRGRSVLPPQTPGPRARVTDFGLAQPAGAEPEAPVSEGEAEWIREVVTAGARGTPAFMSPEQLDAKELDARSDQFSFGVALYQALYGKHPFLGARKPGDFPPIPP